MLIGVCVASCQQICTKDFDQPSGWTVIHIKDIHSKYYSCVWVGVGVCVGGCVGGWVGVRGVYVCVWVHAYAHVCVGGSPIPACFKVCSD